MSPSFPRAKVVNGENGRRCAGFGVFFFASRVNVVNGEKEWKKFAGFCSFFYVSHVETVKGENGGSPSGFVLSSLFLV